MQRAARSRAASMAEMPPRSGRGWRRLRNVSVADRRGVRQGHIGQGRETVWNWLPELSVQIDQVGLNQAHMLTQCREFGNKPITAGGLNPVQLGAKLVDLLGQIIDAGRTFGDSFRRGTDEDALARLADHQTVAAELGDSSPNHRAGDAVGLGQLRGGWDSRADRELPRRNPPPEVDGDLLIGGAPDGLGHLIVLSGLAWPYGLYGTPTLAEAHLLLNYMYYVEHSALACHGRLRTATDEQTRTAPPTQDPPQPHHLAAHRFQLTAR